MTIQPAKHTMKEQCQYTREDICSDMKCHCTIFRNLMRDIYTALTDHTDRLRRTIQEKLEYHPCGMYHKMVIEEIVEQDNEQIYAISVHANQQCPPVIHDKFYAQQEKYERCRRNNSAKRRENDGQEKNCNHQYEQLAQDLVCRQKEKRYSDQYAQQNRFLIQSVPHAEPPDGKPSIMLPCKLLFFACLRIHNVVVLLRTYPLAIKRITISNLMFPNVCD